jgi:hypothetical protein
MDRKPTYTLAELFENLDITLAELGRKSEISEVTVARIRDGKQTRRNTANRLLRTFSTLYNIPLSLNNVTGFKLQNKREEGTNDEASPQQDEGIPGEEKSVA